MSKHFLQIKEEAKQDIITAASWYGEQQKGLDKKYIAAIGKTLDRIVMHPEAGKKIYKKFRQTNVRQFPYIVIYQVLSDSVIIFQVFNTWQNPKKKRRLKL
jgi:plasmid stabilization system protein ParE